MNFWPYIPHYLSYWSEVLYRGWTCNAAELFCSAVKLIPTGLNEILPVKCCLLKCTTDAHEIHLVDF